MAFRVATDTGGTFTDAISVNDKGNIQITKVTTRSQNLMIGTANVIEALAHQDDMDQREFLNQVLTIEHGTTLGTNVIHTRVGPSLGLIATMGHRDVIQLRRVPRDQMYHWRHPFPEPLIPCYLRVEVDERIGAYGEVIRPLNEESVHKAVAYLEKLKVESIVVALLFSFINPLHEKKVGEIIKKDCPEVDVTLSSDILPKWI